MTRKESNDDGSDTHAGTYLAFIRAYMDRLRLPPPELDIAEAIGVRPPTVNQMMKTLQKKGLIRRQPGVARSIEILAPDDVIPEWAGKRITRKGTEKNPSRPAVRPQAQESPDQADVYRFKISLQDTNPKIWRRIETKDISLEQLHELIQTAMGWTNSHLHQFEIAGVWYTDPQGCDGDFGDDIVDYHGIRISDLIAEHGPKLRMGYEYDFGDSWQHDVVIEKVTKSEPGVQYPRCTDGARACPPEDVGGPYGFVDFVEAISDRKHSDYRELRECYGPFDPADFDAAKTTRRMKKGLPRW